MQQIFRIYTVRTGSQIVLWIKISRLGFFANFAHHKQTHESILYHETIAHIRHTNI